jgi:hypothetical protein
MCKFESGKNYKHRSCLDMIIHVVLVHEQDCEQADLLVYYVEKKGRLLYGAPDEIRIHASQYGNWSPVELDNL